MSSVSLGPDSPRYGARDSAAQGAFTVGLLAGRQLDAAIALSERVAEAPHWPRASWLALLDASAPVERVALAAESGGVLSGFLVASIVAGEAELESIVVAAEARRRGLGGVLLHALIEAATVRKVTRLLLEVRASNGRALAFYLATGWREQGRRPRYYADPEEDAVLMALDLPVSGVPCQP